MTVPRLAYALAFAIAWLIASGQAPAQGWPSRSIRWIVPFAPGGAADLISRAVAQRLSEGLGQQVLVENRTGAGGAIGIDAVAKAAPGPVSCCCGCSEQSAFGEAGRGASGDNEVVEHLYVDQGKRRLQGARKHLVCAARLGDAGGVVMGEDQRGCVVP